VFKERLERERSQARQRAIAFVSAAGLMPDGNGWRGALQVGDGRRIPIRVSLPDGFPDQLPVVEVDRNSLPRRVPHIEKSGKICLAPTSGILLDIENPEGLVRDALEIARRTLQEGLTGILDDDFHDEFLAYWNPSDTYLTDCDVLAQTREVELMLMDRAGRSGNSVQQRVLADTLERGQKLIKLLGGTLKNRRTAFFLSLDTPIPAPDFDEVITVREAMRTMRGACGENSWRALHKWLKRPVLPAIILLSIPGCESRVLVAVQFEDVSSAARRKAVRGFRSSHLPAWRELHFAQQQSVKRIGTERYDPAFLLPRGGAMDSLQNKTVAVVGCGAVGSHAIERIASLGVGHFRLVDSEMLDSSNLYRHVLGIAHVGAPKSEGVCDAMRSHYPHIEAQARVADILAVLCDQPEFILSADLILVALGDPTLELRLNEFLGAEKPRLHAWVEPLGLGGHVLATGLGNGPGCFRCLFDRTEETGMANRASFAKAGQSFQKSIAGCAGVFTPFAAIDADRTAIEAARLAARILTGKEIQNQLVSWYGDPDEFERAGFALSKRAKRFQPGERKCMTEIAESACPHCRGRRI
jgi:molybdopterin/thiamine biosynthesis adenylyltransferase